MRSTLGDGTPPQARRAWQAPAITELPISTTTRSAGAKDGSTQACGPANPPPPATPSTKLGFSFEMSLPLSVRTE